MLAYLRIAFVAGLGACATSRGAEPVAVTGPVSNLIAQAAGEAGVPVDLLTAIAAEEGGLQLAPVRFVDPDDNVPIGGMLELRHGKLDTLALGARLMATTEDALRADTGLGTRAGARVLAYLGATADPSTWRHALEQLSGMDENSARDYATRVLAIVHAGGEFRAVGDELVRVAAHPELVDSAPVALVTPATPTPDYPGAIWFTTSCTDKCTVGRPLGHASVNRIVIHDTEGGWNASVATLQNDPGKSVHYIIDADGSRVGQFRPETDTTYHAGNYYYNETSVGIEHVGFASQTYQKALYDRSVDLVNSIRKRWTVPVDRRHIIGHYQIPDGNVIGEQSAPCGDTLDACENSASFGGANNHRDPGYNWQWCQYMESLGGSCTCNDAWDHWNCTTDGAEAWRCTSGTLEKQSCSGVAGCQVMPVGQDDVCDTSGQNGSGTGSDTGSGSGSDQGSGGGGDASGGCSTGGGASSLFVVLAMCGLARRRRVRA